jgi:DnaJ-class molecular chaperone
MTCPRCEGTGVIRATVPATKPGERARSVETGCPLCRGTGKAPGWAAPMAGAAVPVPTKRDAA